MTEQFKPPMVDSGRSPEVATGCTKTEQPQPACPAKVIGPDGSHTLCGADKVPKHPKPNLRESSDAYSRVLVKETGCRVILCKDAIQWIIQHRVRGTQRRAGGRWRSLSYHMDRNSLIRLWHAKTGLSVPEEITTLPASITRLTEYRYRRHEMKGEA